MSDQPGEPEDRSRVCAVCARVLDRHEGAVTGPDGTAEMYVDWRHTGADSEYDDHLPVPVHPSDVHTIYRCDFCLREGATFVVPCRDYQVAPGHMNDGDWAACGPCGGAVEKNRWNVVIRRATEGYQEKNDQTPNEQALRHMYRMLRKNISGSVYQRADVAGPSA